MIGPIEQMALANHPIEGIYFMVTGSPEVYINMHMIFEIITKLFYLQIFFTYSFSWKDLYLPTCAQVDYILMMIESSYIIYYSELSQG